MKFILFCSSLFLFLFIACNNEADPVPGKPLVETHWLIHSVEGDTAGIGGITPRAYLLIRPGNEGLRFQVFGGCNNMLGHIETDSVSSLRFTRIASTRKMCPDMRLEDKLQSLLPEITSYEIAGKRLSLKSNNNDLIRLMAGSHQQR